MKPKVSYSAFDGILQIWHANRHHNLVLFLLRKHANLSRDDEEEFRHELKDSNEALDAEEIEEIVANHKETMEIEFQAHRRTQLQLALASLYGLFEHSLSMVAEQLLLQSNAKVRLSDLNGVGVERAARVLKRVGGVKIDKQSKHWLHVDSARVIRNQIMHSGGLAPISWHPLTSHLNNGDIETEGFGSGEDMVFIIPRPDFIRRCEFHFRVIIEDVVSQLGAPIEQLRVVR